MLFYIEDARIFFLILRKSFSKTVSSARYFQHLLFGLKLVQQSYTPWSSNPSNMHIYFGKFNVF